MLLIAGFASRAIADPIVVPPGLAPGSQYRPVFVTATYYTHPSSNIADDNNIVNTEAYSVPALALLGTTWLASVQRQA